MISKADANRKLKEFERVNHSQEAQPFYVAGKLGRASMPEPEANDVDLGDGARRKAPMRDEQ